jgi:tetrahedral aminopeptidase
MSGFEDEIQAVVSEVLGASCDEVRRDRMGNAIGLKRAGSCPPGVERPLRVVLAAHADEIGMMVKHIEPEGYIRFQPVGGLRTASIMSQPVTIHARTPVHGVIVPEMDGSETLLALDDLLIDVGLPAEEVRQLVELGDPITFDQEFKQLNDKVYMGRNFDDRIGTYCLLEAMNRVGPTQIDVYAVSTVQEEVGVRGIPVAAYVIEPDIGLAIDGSVTRSPYSPPHARTCDLGKGTGIYIMDRLTIGDRRLVRFLFDLCKEHDIPCQRNIGGGTDASVIQRTKSGALATTIGAPVRYMHSTVQLCHEDDIEATVALLTAFLEHAHELPVDAV